VRRGIDPRCSRESTGVDKQIQLDKNTVGDARSAEVQIVGWKRNGDAWVAPKGRTRYFLFQPSLPLNQATWLGACSVLIALARPAFLLRAPLGKSDLYEKRFSYKRYRNRNNPVKR
jgi:hypothetical protein